MNYFPLFNFDRVIVQACKLPIVPGPCEGYYPRYGYNPQTGVCDQFNYGGCLGWL